ncbi:MAG TPA: hypothetical protein IAB06_07510 [Candidatus Avacidaminococcus intestinavium]|uniref:Tetratricopeptide repeat protein n=1 Tax=Candidatus Avacidaminococcus intestinavium TaxID=2840684 RepID=A0A9D1MRC1_9FIRM|nr:hypothetical protein [Candidatus Avacidaminococcus intestinavium]
MTEQEWNEYVNFASGGEWPIPRGMIGDYNNWLCRSIVGRALYFRDKVEEAMTVLATVVDVEPSMEPAEKGMSEAEHKILCLRDIAKIVWGLTGNTEAALNYWDQAIALCESYQHKFNSVARGEISYGRLVMLVAAGHEEEAKAEARELTVAKRFEREGINSYRYFAYRFLAEREHAAGNLQKANLLYEKAFFYYPKSAEGERDYAAAAQMNDHEERYQKYLHMTSMQYLQWEI